MGKFHTVSIISADHISFFFGLATNSVVLHAIPHVYPVAVIGQLGDAILGHANEVADDFVPIGSRSGEHHAVIPIAGDDVAFLRSCSPDDVVGGPGI